MSSIMNRKNSILPIIVLIVVIILVVIIGFLLMSEKTPEPVSTNTPVITTESSGEDTTPVVIENNTKPQVNEDLLASYDGYWVDIIMGGTSNSGEDLWVYYKGDDVVDIDFIDNKSATYFEADDIEITDNHGSFKNAFGMHDGEIDIKGKAIELSFKDNSTADIKNYLFEKRSIRTLTRKDLFNEIDKVIQNNYQDIDTTVFKVKDGNQFMSLGLAENCFIKNRETRSSYDGIDYFRDIYTIDKVKNKLVTISDIIEDEEHARRVDDIISSFISDKIVRAMEDNERWPYGEFMGVLSTYNDSSKYFYIDEDNHYVNIKVFNSGNYGIETYDELWCGVPFIYVFTDERLVSMGIEPMSFVEEVSGEMVSGEIISGDTNL